MGDKLPLDLVLRQRARNRKRLKQRRCNKVWCDIQQGAGMAYGFVTFPVKQHAAPLPHGGGEHG